MKQERINRERERNIPFPLFNPAPGALLFFSFIALDWVLQTGCFAPGFTRNAKSPAMRVVANSPFL